MSAKYKNPCKHVSPPITFEPPAIRRRFKSDRRRPIFCTADLIAGDLSDRRHGDRSYERRRSRIDATEENVFSSSKWFRGSSMAIVNGLQSSGREVNPHHLHFLLLLFFAFKIFSKKMLMMGIELTTCRSELFHRYQSATTTKNFSTKHQYTALRVIPSN